MPVKRADTVSARYFYVPALCGGLVNHIIDGGLFFCLSAMEASGAGFFLIFLLSGRKIGEREHEKGAFV